MNDKAGEVRLCFGGCECWKRAYLPAPMRLWNGSWWNGWILVERLMVERILMERLLVERLMVERLMVERILMERLLMEASFYTDRTVPNAPI